MLAAFGREHDTVEREDVLAAIEELQWQEFPGAAEHAAAATAAALAAPAPAPATAAVAISAPAEVPAPPQVEAGTEPAIDEAPPFELPPLELPPLEPPPSPAPRADTAAPEWAAGTLHAPEPVRTSVQTGAHPLLLQLPRPGAALRPSDFLATSHPPHPTDRSLYPIGAPWYRNHQIKPTVRRPNMAAPTWNGRSRTANSVGSS